MINFDIPKKVKSYIHRVGRTSRAGQSGTALSLVSPSEKEVFTTIAEFRKEQGCEILPYSFKLSSINAFKYRADDVLKSGWFSKDSQL